jgi:hypothetical protein
VLDGPLDDFDRVLEIDEDFSIRSVSPRSMPAPVSFVSSSIVLLQIQHVISHLVDYGD